MFRWLNLIGRKLASLSLNTALFLIWKFHILRLKLGRFIVSHGIACHCTVSYGIACYCTWAVSRKTPFYLIVLLEVAVMLIFTSGVSGLKLVQFLSNFLFGKTSFATVLLFYFINFHHPFTKFPLQLKVTMFLAHERFKWSATEVILTIIFEFIVLVIPVLMAHKSTVRNFYRAVSIITRP